MTHRYRTINQVLQVVFVSLLLTESVTANAAALQTRTLTESLRTPWGMAWVAPQTLLVTEREGTATLLNTDTGTLTSLSGLPSVHAKGQGGLLDVAVPPDFQTGDWIWFTYSKPIGNSAATTLARARLNGDTLSQWQDVLITQSQSGTNRHFGSRIAFDNRGHIFFSVGDRGERPNGQDLNTHAGSILRLNRDGSVPEDNPFVGRSDALPEIYSYGHRNPQGLCYDAALGGLWASEHGPRGGDEINLIKAGANYGWPVVSHGKEYWGPMDVGEAKHKPGMEDPKHVYIPSIAPGSLLCYSKGFSAWTNSLFQGALKLTHLNRVTLNSDGFIASEERLLEGNRIRALLQSPSGDIYFSTDSGTIGVLSPAP